MDCRAAVLHATNEPLSIETVRLAPPGPDDVLVRIRAAGLCHTDLEVIGGALPFPLPIVLGHEAAGTVEEVGTNVADLAAGQHVVLSWNPHCGHCYYCDRDLPILCEQYVKQGPAAKQFDGRTSGWLADGRELHRLMFLGAFAEYCVVPRQLAVPVPEALPFDQACLIGCGVMTGAGAALNIADLRHGDSVAVIGCGAVGLSAVQGARLRGAKTIVAIDLDEHKLAIAKQVGATHAIDGRSADVAFQVRALTGGRGADAVFESAGHVDAYRTTMEAVRPGGQVVWLGKVPVDRDVAFRWGSLMGEKRIRRSSYGGARPARDFPRLADACLDGSLHLEPMVTRRIALDEINDGFAALAAGQAIRSVIVF